MADIGENLRTAIVSSTAVLHVFADAAGANRVCQAIEPEEPEHPRIWYGRSGSNEDVDLAGAGGLVEDTFDVEVISDDLDEAQDIAMVVKRFLNGKRGTFGGGSVQGIFVQDHNDDYIPRGISDESGLNVAALSVSIWYSST
jgi:hypothetical protein